MSTYFHGRRILYGLGCFILVVIFKYFDNEAEGTILMYPFIEYICYDLKDIAGNNSFDCD